MTHAQANMSSVLHSYCPRNVSQQDKQDLFLAYFVVLHEFLLFERLSRG